MRNAEWNTVTQTQLVLDQQTMNICLEEFPRCQRTSPRPHFIVVFGEDYNWCSLPPQIAATEFDPVFDSDNT